MPGIIILAQWLEIMIKYHPEFIDDLEKFVCDHNETCELCPLAGCACCIDTDTLRDYLQKPVDAKTLKYMYRLAEGANRE